MDKFTFQKDWYKSKRLAVLITVAIMLVANDMFGLGLDEGTVKYVVELGLAFIVGKSIQDAAASYAEVKGKAIVEEAKLRLPPQP